VNEFPHPTPDRAPVMPKDLAHDRSDALSPAPPPSQPDTLDPAADPIAIFRWLATRVEGYVSTFARLPLPADLRPEQIETALLTTLNCASHTTHTMSRVIEQAAEDPTSTAYEEALAHLQQALAQTSAQIQQLEARRQLDQLHWGQRLRIQARYQAALDRLWAAQGRVQHQRERFSARWHHRQQAAQQRAIRAEAQQRERVQQQELRALRQELYRTPGPAGMPGGAASDPSGLYQGQWQTWDLVDWDEQERDNSTPIATDQIALHEQRSTGPTAADPISHPPLTGPATGTAAVPTASDPPAPSDAARARPPAAAQSRTACSPEQSTRALDPDGRQLPAGSAGRVTGRSGRAPQRDGSGTRRQPSPAAELVRIADPYAPAGWRMVPRAQVPPGARILPFNT